MTPVYVCVLSFTKMHDCKPIISCTRDNNVLYRTILKKLCYITLRDNKE